MAVALALGVVLAAGESRAQDRGSPSGVGIGLVFISTIPLVLSATSVVIDSVSLGQLATGRTPSLSQRLTSAVFALTGGVLNGLFFASFVRQPELRGLAIAEASLVALNVAGLVLNCALTFQRAPISVAPFTTGSASGLAMALRW
jgi:hypothetical protein